MTIRLLALTLTVVLLCGMLAPQPAYAQGFGGLTAIFNAINGVASSVLTFINNTMRPLLEGIRTASNQLQSFLGQLRNLWEQIVWPIGEIDRIRGLAQQLISQFQVRMRVLYFTGVDSAQLPNPASLEGIVRNRQVNDHTDLVAAYARTYGALPAATDAHPEERNLADVDDAMAINQLMTLKQADAGADQTLLAAEAIEEEATRMAPGTAAYASAAAYIAAVQSQAHMQKMIAGQLRQEAARLAHETMLLKRGAAFTRESRNKMTEMNR
jgi:hypothetical protein